MIMRFVLAGSILTILLVIAGCGREEPRTESGDPAGFLPEEVPAVDLARSSEPRTYVGDSLWEYINGGAEVYHSYGFVDVATADYVSGELELVIDIYRFEAPRGAYGLFSSIRPPDPNVISLAADGFITSTSLNFVKGQYLGRITAFQPSERLSQTMTSAARTVAELLPGTAELPNTFALFPASNRVPHSEQIYAESFLGRQSLAWVYTDKYSLNGDTTTLFLIPDDAEAKFDRFRLSTETAEIRLRAAPRLLFDGAEGFIFEHSYYGMTAIGMKGARLVGMIGVTDDSRTFFNTWLNSLDARVESD